MNERQLTQISVLPGKQEIIITRIFDAPRELVYEAITNPDHIPHWWGPRRLITVIDELNLKPGGIWRFVQHDRNGNRYAFHGVYHTCQAPEMLVYTFEFEGAAGHVLLKTTTLENYGRKTKMIDQSVFQSIQARDAMLKSGMEQGAKESMDRLQELLEKKTEVSL